MTLCIDLKVQLANLERVQVAEFSGAKTKVLLLFQPQKYDKMLKNI